MIRIYKANKGIYGGPRIHHILRTKGFNASLKRIERKMDRKYYIYSYYQRWLMLFSFSS
ncbi:IS3 family transposase [Clostridium butyricum]|nr:IS3 family transposase [Clostridium butyricum]